MRALRFLVTPLCLLASLTAHAADYRVDMIVTLNRNAPADAALLHGVAVQPAEVRAGVDISDPPGLKRFGISLLPDREFGLDAEWRKLRNTPFRPVLRLAWRITQRPTATTVRLHDNFRYRVMPVALDPALPPVSVGNTGYERYRLDGSLLVQQSAGLRVVLDLDYTLRVSAPPADYPSSSGVAVSVSAAELAILRLHAEKRINLGQIHFIDHPVLGVLLRVSQAQ